MLQYPPYSIMHMGENLETREIFLPHVQQAPRLGLMAGHGKQMVWHGDD